jgi:hypothetical protein
MFNIYRSETAVTPLRAVWDEAGDELRQAILRASHLINQRLHENPHEEGESRAGGTRILFEAPVGVEFEIDEKRKLVSIVRSWAYRAAANEQNDAE